MTPDLTRLFSRRQFLRQAAIGTTVSALGAAYVVGCDSLSAKARAETRSDGRPRLPPGQRVIERLKPMGGEEGDPAAGHFHLRIYGEVEKPLVLDFATLLAQPIVTQSCDVHCVTGWSVLGATWKGISIVQLAKLAQPKPSARYAIIEGANGYTANVSLADALRENSLIVFELDGRPLALANGAPVRALIPDLYFWKSAKWLTGIRFTQRDEAGYWEVRGYHNHGDPWREERYG